MYATVDPDQPLSEIAELAANAEDLFEETGIDYWFGWNRPLRAACQAADVGPEDVAFRLLARDPEPVARSRESLVSLLSDLDQHFDLQLAPALVRARQACARLGKEVVAPCQSTMDTIERVLRAHVETVRRTLSLAATSIDVGAEVTLDEQILRHLAMEHSVLALRAGDLRAEAVRCEGTEFAAAALALIRGIHQHIKISYNFILPRLIAAVRRPSSRE